MNPLGVTLIILFTGVVFAAPRRWAALAVIAAICYVTQGQQVAVFGFHFTAIRIVLLAGIVRIVTRGESRGLELNGIDRAVLVYPIIIAVLSTIRRGTSQELVYQLGCSYDIVLSYLVFRCLLDGVETVRELLPALAVLILPFALIMAFEGMTGTNLFRSMGGQGWEGAVMREGRYRCVASFRGPITAGIFGASLMPLFVGMAFGSQRRSAAVVGLIAATMITYLSNSSGPLMAFISGIVGLLFWPLRKNMRMVRWGIVVALTSLHFLMKAPVWYLLAKLSSLTGGDGWHRSYLVDQCIKHFFRWWLIGTNDTSDWAATLLAEGGADLTNKYVASAAAGGLAALVVFIVILVRCFRNLGRAMEVARGQSLQTESILWALGAALFAHVVTLFSVTYFDQMGVAWYFLLAAISSSTSDIVRNGLVVEGKEPSSSEPPALEAVPQFGHAVTNEVLLDPNRSAFDAGIGNTWANPYITGGSSPLRAAESKTSRHETRF
jgi:hypothetical protein